MGQFFHANQHDFVYTAPSKKAGWQSGHAADCNSVHAGSIPTPASTTLLEFDHFSDIQFDSERDVAPPSRQLSIRLHPARSANPSAYQLHCAGYHRRTVQRPCGHGHSDPGYWLVPRLVYGSCAGRCFLGQTSKPMGRQRYGTMYQLLSAPNIKFQLLNSKRLLLDNTFHQVTNGNHSYHLIPVHYG